MFTRDWSTSSNISNCSTLNIEHNWERTYVSSQEINKHAFPINITTYGGPISNPTCSRHFLTWWGEKILEEITHVAIQIRRDGKSKLKGHKMWVPRKTRYLYSSFRPPTIGNKSTYAVNMGWERISPLKIYGNFKTQKQIVILLLNVVLSAPSPMKNHPNITHVLCLLMQKCLHYRNTSMSTLT